MVRPVKHDPAANPASLRADESKRSVLLFGNPLFTGPTDRHSAEAGKWTRAAHLEVKRSRPLPIHLVHHDEAFSVGGIRPPKRGGHLSLGTSRRRGAARNAQVPRSLHIRGPRTVPARSPNPAIAAPPGPSLQIGVGHPRNKRDPVAFGVVQVE